VAIARNGPSRWALHSIAFHWSPGKSAFQRAVPCRLQRRHALRPDRERECSACKAISAARAPDRPAHPLNSKSLSCTRSAAEPPSLATTQAHVRFPRPICLWSSKFPSEQLPFNRSPPEWLLNPGVASMLGGFIAGELRSRGRGIAISKGLNQAWFEGDAVCLRSGVAGRD
jgi:hypothetical protein